MIENAAISVLVNPYSGRGSAGRYASTISDELQAAGLQFKMFNSTEPSDLERRARETCMRGSQIVVVVGGDGAIHETVNGIVQADADPLLAIIPAGTGNDFRKATHVPREWRAATEYVIDRLRREQPARRIDLGRCNDRVFINGCGMGFDAQVNQIASGFKLLQGNVVYGFALIKQLVRGVDNTRMRIRADNQSIDANVTLIAANNGSHTGGMFHIAPQSSIQDGLLEIVMATDLNRLQVLKLAPHVMRGTHIGRKNVKSLRCRTLTIESSETLPVQVDGEMLPTKQNMLKIDVLPGRLRLLG